VVPITSLLLPILVAAVLVFVASSIIHMLLPIHKNDWRAMPAEDRAQAALRTLELSPGDYALPYAGSAAMMKDPAFLEKMTKGPVVIMTVVPPGPPAMGARLALWFGYSVLVGIFAAYVAGRALEPGAHYLSVFRFAGTTAFAAYSLALLQNSIWFNRNWAATLRSMGDGLVYALLTAGTFGWLWPQL
jgi:hypothetical protein